MSPKSCLDNDGTLLQDGTYKESSHNEWKWSKFWKLI